MAHEVDTEDLSAYFDDELPAQRKAEITEHLRTCSSCSQQLESLKRTSAAVREHARQPLPAGLLARILARLRPKRSEFAEFGGYALIFVACLLLIVVSGMALKHFMPGLICQIQGMISGAADSMGK